MYPVFHRVGRSNCFQRIPHRHRLMSNACLHVCLTCLPFIALLFHSCSDFADWYSVHCTIYTLIFNIEPYWTCTQEKIIKYFRFNSHFSVRAQVINLTEISNIAFKCWKKLSWTIQMIGVCRVWNTQPARVLTSKWSSRQTTISVIWDINDWKLTVVDAIESVI